MRFALAWMSLGVSLFSLNGCFNVGDDDAAPEKVGQAGEDGTGGTKTSGGTGGSAGSGTGANAGKSGDGGKPGFLGRGGSAGKSSAGQAGTDAAAGTGGSTGGTGGTGGDAGDDSGGTGGTTGGKGGTDNGGESGTTGGTGGAGGTGTGGTGGGASGSGGTGGGGMGGTGAIPGFPTSPTGTCEDYSDKLEECGVIDRAIDCQYWQEDTSSPCIFGCVAAGACGDVADYACNGSVAENAVKDCSDRCDQFECTNGTRWPLGYYCDGEDDCADGEDEVGCFMCDGHSVRYSSLCDGFADCADESDEAGCPATPPKFACATGSEEVPASYRCDRVDDCTDGSDELDCPIASCNQGEAPVRGAACAVAAEQLNACGLLPAEVLASCTDGTARKACEKTCYATASCDVLEAALCGDGGDSLFECMDACTSVTDFVPCDDGANAVPSEWICDDYADCEDGTDEANCDFVCLNGAGSLTSNYVCNSVDNCGDNSDESGCEPTCP